jgi:small GTP-binding protein
MMLQKKVCILGPSGVGKTSLIKRYVDGIFSDKYLTSIGVKIDKKIVNNVFTPTQLMIWDLEGIDRYCGFNPSYLRGAHAYVVVADQSRANSLIEAKDIFDETLKHIQVPCILVINKSDLPVAEGWNTESVDSLKQAFNASFITSAKSGDAVEDMFTMLAKLATE